MNIVDTSGLIAFLNDEANADIFAGPIGNIRKLLVPTICLYEIFKFAKQKQGQVLPLTETIALEAANISINYKLAMADSLIYASAKIANAIVWTQDEDFKGLPGVKYYTKKIKTLK